MSREEEIEHLLDGLPTPTNKPCRECPWRRASAAGWLGPHSPEEWLQIVHGESPIACHLTVKSNDQDWSELRQCGGSAIYRANICKMPHHPNVAVADEQDTTTVFAWDNEFLAHHKREAVEPRRPGRRIAQ